MHMQLVCLALVIQAFLRALRYRIKVVLCKTLEDSSGMLRSSGNGVLDEEARRLPGRFGAGPSPRCWRTRKCNCELLVRVSK